MILDDRLEFADATTLVANVSTATILGDVIDVGSPGILGTANTSNYIGDGEPAYLVIQITTSVAATGGASNVTFALYSHSTTTVTSGTAHWTSSAIAKGTLVAGYNIIVPLPSATYARYVGVVHTSDTNAVTTGAANAFITKDVSKWIAAADSLTKDTVG